uniref:Uncharacterized protein n=1 Tax=Arundo donax TaxID=35708 RepID=A0A0A8Y547_ARUDO
MVCNVKLLVQISCTRFKLIWNCLCTTPISQAKRGLSALHHVGSYYSIILKSYLLKA